MLQVAQQNPQMAGHGTWLDIPRDVRCLGPSHLTGQMLLVNTQINTKYVLGISYWL